MIFTGLCISFYGDLENLYSNSCKIVIVGYTFKYVKKDEKPGENFNIEVKNEHHKNVNNSDECHVDETGN